VTTPARCIIAAAVATLAAPAWAEDPYGGMAAAVGSAARAGGVSRVAVMPFRPAAGRDADGGVLLSERLIETLVTTPGMTVVERTSLGAVMAEQRLGAQGVVAPRQAAAMGLILGADAVVTGTFVSLSGGKVEVHARLIDTATARVLGTTRARVRKEWEEALMPVGALWNVEPPREEDFPAPLVTLIPDPFRDAPHDQDCGNWTERADRLRTRTLALKARLWASRLLDPAFDARTVTRNPGSEIHSLELRQRFYSLVREYYEAGIPALSPAERDSLAAAEGAADAVAERCR
jgi:TolB-like protein